MVSRPFAVFDIDGTIIRWQLYHALADQLAKQGHISQVDFQRVKEARLDWKRRTGEDSFQDYEIELVKVFNQALASLKVVDFAAASSIVFKDYKEQVYTYTRDLIRQLQTKDYLLFAISGSPSILVQQLAEYYGFDDFAASNYPTKSGKFIGTVDLSIGKKPQLLQELVEKHSAHFTNSIAVGDSEGDISMLELVAQPIAFNPSKKLYRHARAKNWQIIVERKNVVYRLTPDDTDQYSLY